jgi:hypothetical protein
VAVHAVGRLLDLLLNPKRTIEGVARTAWRALAPGPRPAG